MAEFSDLDKTDDNNLLTDIAVQLVKEDKAYLLMVVFDSSKTTKKGISARLNNTFSEKNVYAWFMGK